MPEIKMLIFIVSFAGDHKQLRPNVSVYELGKYYNFDISLFERMVMNRKGCVTLQVQHRMAPEMAKLIVPTIYEKLENHKSVLGRPNVRGLLKRLYFLSHSQKELQVYLTSIWVQCLPSKYFNFFRTRKTQAGQMSLRQIS
jgi:hypothetical protein